LLDDSEDRCCLKVPYKLLYVPLIAQIVASREEALNLQLVVKQALMPQVLTKPSLCGQFSVIWEVIVPLSRMQLVVCTLFITDVKPNVESHSLRVQEPSQLLHCSFHVWFDRNQLAEYNIA
jgi:hypothetical protein